MKYEHKVLLIRTGFAVLTTLAGVGTATGVVATQRVVALENQIKEAKAADKGCPVCPKTVICKLQMDPIKGELLFKEKK